jgi:hypothetical protein
VTRLRAGQSGVRIPVGPIYFIFSKTFKQSTSLLYKGYPGSFLGGKPSGAYSCYCPSLRMSGTILLIILHAFMAWTRTTFPWSFMEWKFWMPSLLLLLTDTFYPLLCFKLPCLCRLHLPHGYKARVKAMLQLIASQPVRFDIEPFLWRPQLHILVLRFRNVAFCHLGAPFLTMESSVLSDVTHYVSVYSTSLPGGNHCKGLSAIAELRPQSSQ